MWVGLSEQGEEMSFYKLENDRDEIVRLSFLIKRMTDNSGGQDQPTATKCLPIKKAQG